MFADNITWQNDSLRLAAEAQCGEDHDCLFDVASTKDLSVGVLTKDINVQLVNETNSLGKSSPSSRRVPTEVWELAISIRSFLCSDSFTSRLSCLKKNIMVLVTNSYGSFSKRVG